MNKPPKKKKKPKKTIDPEHAVLELHRKDLIGQAQHLTEEVAAENTTKQEFDSRLEQTQSFWEIEKKLLENKKRQLQQIEDGQEEASSIHALHLNDLREQIKHQLYQQQNELTQIKNKAQLEVLHVRRELSQVVSKKTLDIVEHQDIMKEAETAHYNFMTRLRSNRDEKVASLHSDFKRNFRQFTEQSERNMKQIREEKEAVMDQKLKELEIERENQKKILEQKYETMLDDLRTLYNGKLHGELNGIQELKRKLSCNRKVLRQTEKQTADLETKHKDIVGPFAKTKEDMIRLGKEREDYNVKNKLLEERKIELTTEEHRLKDLRWRHEVLFQKFLLLENESRNIHKIIGNKRLERQQRQQLTEMVLGKQTEELLDLGRLHTHDLSKLLNDFGEESKQEGEDRSRQYSSKIEIGKESIENLEGVQIKMQHLHNMLLTPRRTSPALLVS